MAEITNYGKSQQWVGEWKCSHAEHCGAEWTMKPEHGADNNGANKPVNIRTVGDVKVYKMNCPVCHQSVEGPEKALDSLRTDPEKIAHAAKHAKPAKEHGETNADDGNGEVGDAETLPVSAPAVFPTPHDTSSVQALKSPAINLPPAAHGEGPNEAIKQVPTVTQPVDGVDHPPIVHPYGSKEETPLEPTKSAIAAKEGDTKPDTHPAKDDKAKVTENGKPVKGK